MSYFDSDTLNFCCGVKEFGNFSLGSLPYSFRSGTGYYVATFVDTQACKDAYEVLKKEFNIIFQSLPKRNKLSGRKVFIVIYQDK